MSIIADKCFCFWCEIEITNGSVCNHCFSCCENSVYLANTRHEKEWEQFYCPINFSEITNNTVYTHSIVELFPILREMKELKHLTDFGLTSAILDYGVGKWVGRWSNSNSVQRHGSRNFSYPFYYAVRSTVMSIFREIGAICCFCNKPAPAVYRDRLPQKIKEIIYPLELFISRDEIIWDPICESCSRKSITDLQTSKLDKIIGDLKSKISALTHV